MRRWFRRFAAVGLVVTATDVAILFGLRLGLDVPVLIADAVAVTVAAVLSYVLHRAVTFAEDPYVRWVREPGTFVRAALAAGAVDVVLLRALAVVLDTESFLGLAVAKAVALGAAAVVRARAYRGRLLEVVRDVQRTRAPRPPAPGRVRLSVVIPAYCEEARIGSTVAAVRDVVRGIDGGAEIVVVDDGSSDGTAGAAEAAGADVVVRQPQNLGKGAAVRAGMAATSGRTVAFTDADLSYPPSLLVRLLEEVESGWDMVVGSRKHVDTTTLVRAGRLREVAGRVFNLLTQAVVLGNYRDTQCGIKAFRADVAHSMFARSRVDGFAFDVELFHLAERDRASLLEVPVALSSSASSSVRVGPQSAAMIRDLFRIRLWAGQGRYDRRSEVEDAPRMP